MGMHKNKANFKTPRKRSGFSAIELLVTAAILAIVTGFGLMGITRARAAIRLSGAAREYASHIEKARMFSIRHHADDADQRARVAINADQISYDVTMDLDADGDMDTTTIPLPEGISFKTVETIAFDWRGRTWNTANGVTSPNAQVSIRMIGPNDSVWIDVTGSGDITIDSQVFDDSVPTVSLRVGDLAGGATPVPTPESVTPEPSPDLSPSPTPGVAPSATPTPGLDGIDPVVTPTPSSTPTPSPSPTATPTPSPSPRATPTPLVCTLSTDRALVTMFQDDTPAIKVSVTSNATVSISGSTSKPSDLQVSPGGAQSVSSGGSATFTIKSKKSTGTYTVTLSSSCDTKVVTVIVLPKPL